jgi:hypothetical protein
MIIKHSDSQSVNDVILVNKIKTSGKEIKKLKLN